MAQLKIILLRHGKPIVPPLNKLNALEFSDWVNQYNAAGLCSTSVPTKYAQSYADKCNAIVCSDLLRSIESAKVFNKGNIVLSDSIFNEAGLPIADWKTFKLSPKIWAIIFRFFWLLGYSKNSESFKEAKIRASKSVEKLISIAQEYESVLFVGHGVYNRILANKLRQLGWSGPKNPGTKHWEFAVYEKKEN